MKGRKKGLFSKLVDVVLGEPIPTLAEAKSAQRGKTSFVGDITDLPQEYDDTPLSGDRYVNNRCCRTVGDLKDACNSDDPDFWIGVGS